MYLIVIQAYKNKANGQVTSCKLMKSSPVHVNINNDNILQIQII